MSGDAVSCEHFGSHEEIKPQKMELSSTEAEAIEVNEEKFGKVHVLCPKRALLPKRRSESHFC